MNSNDYDVNGNRITPYRSVHVSRYERRMLIETGENSYQRRDSNGFYHLR